eukprot:scaffold80059_cov63-Phaeocystis_antarctica.AAC.3
MDRRPQAASRPAYRPPVFGRATSAAARCTRAARVPQPRGAHASLQPKWWRRAMARSRGREAHMQHGDRIGTLPAPMGMPQRCSSGADVPSRSTVVSGRVGMRRAASRGALREKRLQNFGGSDPADDVPVSLKER